jgi:hypothetical protein
VTRMPRSHERCTYCGEAADTKDHVIPKSFFNKEIRTSTSSPSMVLVPSCRQCNNFFSKHEKDARPELLMAGPTNDAVRSLFFGNVVRDLSRPEGRGSLMRLYAKLRPVTLDGCLRMEIVPHLSVDVTFVLRKIIRGLSRHHGLIWPVPDTGVDVHPMNIDLPDALVDALEHHVCDPSVFRYGFCVTPLDDLHSVWRITFYGTRTFLGAIRRNSSGVGVVNTGDSLTLKEATTSRDSATS